VTDSSKPLVSVTAYHSFGGEVEALNTPTIRRLTFSCRHQLSALAFHVGAARGGGLSSVISRRGVARHPSVREARPVCLRRASTVEPGFPPHAGQGSYAETFARSLLFDGGVAQTPA
jgi:hypothetical protein